MPVYKFRNCLLNTAERLVIKDNQHVDLTTKTFDVLQFLVENPGRTLTKDEFMGEVWNGDFVEESNLPVHISKLRRSLGNEPSSRFIETVQGVGYRFIAPVSLSDNDAWQETVQILSFRNERSSKARVRYGSIAVLPLENESSDSDLTYLADGLTESLINRFSIIPDLKVIARNTVFRYKGVPVDLREIGNILNVEVVMAGRIRFAGQVLTACVELMDVAKDRQIWGKQFSAPLEQLVALKDNIAAAIIDKLICSEYSPDFEPTSHTESSESYKFYLKAKYLLNKRSAGCIQAAIECFQAALETDPNNELAYAGLVECYRLLHILDVISYEVTIQQVRPLLKALASLDGATDVEYLSQAKVMFLEWKFQDALRNAKRSAILNPNNIEAHFICAEICTALGELDTAVEYLKAVLSLDPLSFLTYKRIGRGYYRLGMFDTAQEYLDIALELEPGDYETLALMGAVCVELGHRRKAAALFEQSIAMVPNTEVLSMLGYCRALEGDVQRAGQICKEIAASSPDPDKHALKLARIYLALGQKAVAYELLDTAFQNHEVDLNALNYDPRLELLRGESRFRELVARVGLPLQEYLVE